MGVQISALIIFTFWLVVSITIFRYSNEEILTIVFSYLKNIAQITILETFGLIVYVVKYLYKDITKSRQELLVSSFEALSANNKSFEE